MDRGVVQVTEILWQGGGFEDCWTVEKICWHFNLRRNIIYGQQDLCGVVGEYLRGVVGEYLLMEAVSL